MRLQEHQILVTGADGFIGSHLTEELLRLGCQVRAMVLYNSFNSWGWLEQLPLELRYGLEVVAGDIRDPQSAATVMEGCDVVFHLAALIAIPHSCQSPDSFVATNMQGTLNLLQAARHFNVACFVHTSTSEVYGSARYVPIDEEHPLQGQSPYAATKIAADQLALVCYRSFGTPVTIVRLFPTYGPRQSARAVIPALIAQLSSSRNDVQLGPLYPTRDFNFISDTVRGLMAAAESESALGEVINIGSGFDVSVGELATLITGLLGHKAAVAGEEQERRPPPSEVGRLAADNSKALRLLGWEPEYAGRQGLRRGLAQTIAWFSDPDNLLYYHPEEYNI
jgi:NAD dependent epimerase/dehydratase